MIHITSGLLNRQKTALKKIKDNLWEFTIVGPDDERIVDFETMNNDILERNSTINKNGIQSLIKNLKNIIQAKPSNRQLCNVEWVSNLANITFECMYNEKHKYYTILILADNRCRKNFRYTPSDYDIMFARGEDTINYRSGPGVDVSEMNLRKYILELELEIGEKTQEDLDKFMIEYQKWQEEMKKEAERVKAEKEAQEKMKDKD